MACQPAKCVSLERAGVGAVATEPRHMVIPTELFDRAHVQDVAKRIHGGWNGIDAACSHEKAMETRRTYTCEEQNIEDEYASTQPDK